MEKDPSECQVSTKERAWHENQNGFLNFYFSVKKEACTLIENHEHPQSSFRLLKFSSSGNLLYQNNRSCYSQIGGNSVFRRKKNCDFKLNLFCQQFLEEKRYLVVSITKIFVIEKSSLLEQSQLLFSNWRKFCFQKKKRNVVVSNSTFSASQWIVDIKTVTIWPYKVQTLYIKFNNSTHNHNQVLFRFFETWYLVQGLTIPGDTQFYFTNS